MTAISAPASAALVRLANGEYTAASVKADPTAASNLGLVEEKDGNYGTAKPTASSNRAATAQSSSAVLMALSSLTLGG
jgi:hypothetical protein